MSLTLPSRFRRLNPGSNLSELLDDFFPANSFEVNGETFHREELEQICQFIGGKHDQFKAVDAFLKREPENPFDPNAVAVYVHEKKVGYVPKNQAFEFSKFLLDYENGIWVHAAIRFVSALGQYRIRFFAQTPFELDLSALPILDAKEIPQIEFENSQPQDDHYLDEDKLQWRTEQVSSTDFVSYCGPETVRLELVDWRELNSRNEDLRVGFSIKIFKNNHRIGIISDLHESYNFLYERLWNVGGIALSTLYGVSADTTQFWFSNDLKPKAEAQEPDLEDWREIGRHDDFSDSGPLPF